MVRDDVDRSAPVLVRCERFIRAPVERLWRTHLDINAWPSWQTASLDRWLENLADAVKSGG